LHGSAPVQVAPNSSRDPTTKLKARIKDPKTIALFRFPMRLLSSSQIGY